MGFFNRVSFVSLSFVLLSFAGADEIDGLPLTQPQCTNFYPATGPFFTENFATQPPQVPATLHVVSYNVDYNENLPGLLHDFTTLPTLKNADFILLQEVTGTVGHQENGAQAIAKTLGLNYVFSPNIVLHGKDYGNAILSKWPISQIKKILLPMSSSEHCNLRSGLAAVARVGGKDVVVVSVHLSVRFPDTLTNDRDRALQMQPVIDQINRAPQDTPVFVSGDMNTANPFGFRSLAALFTANHFENAHPVAGWTFKTHHFTLDHAFSRGVQNTGSGTEYNAQGSDHVPIWFDLGLH